jgi:hypothetical protein
MSTDRHLEAVFQPMTGLQGLMNVFNFRFGSAVIFLSVVLAACGCSWKPSDEPELGLVSGTVTMDGKPLPGVWVGFAPTEGRSSMGLTDKDGRYELNYLLEKKGAKVGQHKVAITTPQEDESGGIVPNFKELIPPQYNSNTNLTAEVKPGSNTINFELAKKPATRKGP